MTKEDISVRVTITVPKSLQDRAAALEGRFNVSRACQEGLEMAVKKEETKTMKGGEMAKLAARLKVEKEELEKREQANGFERGLSSAMNLSFEKFKIFERIDSSWSNDVSVEDNIYPLLKTLNLEFEDVFWGRDDEPATLDRDSYLIGYVEGVMEAWQKVEAEL
jgi:post-segregation antitoxin (ccd killing protein)